MAIKLEQMFNEVQQQGLYSDKTVSLGGSVSLSGSVAVSGSLALSGAVSGVRRGVTVGTTASYAPAAADSGMVYVATRSSSTQTYTLPAATTAGLVFSFICGHASGEILINPQSGESIVATAFSAVGASPTTAIVAPAAGTGIKNTAATNAVGDSITLVSDGLGSWYGLGISSGIWASQ